MSVDIDQANAAAVERMTSARPVLTETPQPVTRIERQGRRTTKREERFAGFGSPPGKF